MKTDAPKLVLTQITLLFEGEGGPVTIDLPPPGWLKLSLEVPDPRRNKPRAERAAPAIHRRAAGPKEAA